MNIDVDLLLQRLRNVFLFFYGPLEALWEGVRAKTLPLATLGILALAIQLSVYRHWDWILWDRLHMAAWYPSGFKPFCWYYTAVVLSPLWLWAMWQAGRKRIRLRRLTETFRSIGLQNNLGNIPNYISDWAIDAHTRKLRLTRAALPMEAFRKKTDALQGALQIHVDEMRENRELGTVDIIYAHAPMPSQFGIDKERLAKLSVGEFLVGTTRSHTLRSCLREVAHLLVAGQTGGGKSTFLRQLITSLYLKDRAATFVLIDLKGGLEFQTFERLPRIAVIPSVALAIHQLKWVSEAIDARMALLKEAGCRDLEEYLARRSKDKNGARQMPATTMPLQRQVIVVDEAAEMFLAGDHATGQDVQLARRILSQVARQGRSLGIHLIVATQRPDSRALDPQIKANLPGVLCYQMVNDASSISVLGTGRATDLPAIPGRGIWKRGGDLVEVQTPFLSLDDAEALLEPLRLPQESDPPSIAPTPAEHSPIPRHPAAEE